LFPVPQLELEQIFLGFTAILLSGFFHKLREKIALKQQEASEGFSGEIELDEHYFWST